VAQGKWPEGHAWRLNRETDVNRNHLPASATSFLALPRMESSELQEYVPVAMLAILAVVFAFGMLIVSVLVGFKRRRAR
jgi:hypothetical protein